MIVYDAVVLFNFNPCGSRRGNDEVMVRGTFANVRFKYKLAQKEGGYTSYRLAKKCLYMTLPFNIN